MKKMFIGAVLAGFLGPGQAFAGEGDFMLSVGNGLGFAGMEKTPAMDVGTRIGMRSKANTFFGIVDYFRVAGEADGDDRVSASLTTVGVGIRHALRSTKPKKASPYLVGAVYTALPSTSDDDVNEELTDLRRWVPSQGLEESTFSTKPSASQLKWASSASQCSSRRTVLTSRALSPIRIQASRSICICSR